MEVQTDASNGIFPLTYTDPFSSEKIYWICDVDADGKITSVFLNTNRKERHCAYYSMDNVLDQEAKLKAVGWVKCKQPEINITFDEHKLPRKVRRKLERQNKK